MHKIHKLKSGIRVIFVPKKEIEVVTVACAFAVGSRHEKESEQGMSHFLEHMIYKGAKRRKTAREVSLYIDSLGAEHNAFTSKEYTGYYVKVASKHLEKAFDFLSDNIVYASISEGEIEKERNVILEEIKMYEDLPHEKASELFEMSAFSGLSLARNIAGTKKCVENFQKKELLDFKSTKYVSENMICVIAGNYDTNLEENICHRIETYFQDLPDSGKIVDGFEIESDRILLAEKKIEQVNLIMGFHSIDLNSDERYAVDILGKILGGSMSSRLFSKIREDLGLVYRIFSNLNAYSDAGAFIIETSLAPKNLSKAIRAILIECEKIVQKGIKEDELKNAIEMISGQIVIDTEDSSELAMDYLLSLLVCNKIETPEEKIKRYKAVTLEEVNKVAKKYLSGKIYLSAVGPGLDKGKIEQLINQK